MIYRDKDGKCVEIHKNNHNNDLDYMKEIVRVALLSLIFALLF